VFSVGLEFFFAGAREKPVAAIVRKKYRLRFPQKPGGRQPSAYEFQSLDFPAPERRFDTFYADFLPVSAREPLQRHHHVGAEFIYVLRGALKLDIGEDEYVLEEGDSIYFDPNVPHGYRRQGARACSAIVVAAG
jgi:mannose-6-phosphate isomerase-like protein (cupin superfamily)